MKEDMKTQLLTKSPKELLFKLAIPGIIGMIVIGLYPFMDGVFAGWLIGDYAMSIYVLNDYKWRNIGIDWRWECLNTIKSNRKGR